MEDPLARSIGLRDHLARAREALRSAFGPRFRRLLLFGSEAHRSAAPDSDIDLMLVLEGPISLAADLGTAVDAVYPIQLELLRPLHVIPAAETDLERGDFALYRHVRAEGLAI